MSGHRPGTSYGHSCKAALFGYEISWVVDYYYPDRHCRFRRRFGRFTDRAGAERFCKRHGINLPIQEPACSLQTSRRMTG